MAGVYCVDTSSLISLKVFERDVFRSVWDTVEEFIRSGRMFAPREVLRELRVGDDEIHAWAKLQAGLFADLDETLATVLKEVQSRFPSLADPSRMTPHADPWVVALAITRARANPERRCHVVTEEKLRGQGSAKIPNVCQALDVPCTNLVGVFRLEGRVF